MKRANLDFTELLARYGADLAVVFSHIEDEDEANGVLKELFDGVRDEASGIRKRRAAANDTTGTC